MTGMTTEMHCLARWAYASEKNESESKRCPLYDTCVEESYKRKQDSRKLRTKKTLKEWGNKTKENFHEKLLE